MKCRGRLMRFTAAIGVLLVASSWAADSTTEEKLVVTSLQATYSVTSALSKGTSVRVINITNSRTPMARHKSAIKRNQEQLRPIVESADAVVSIRSIWKADPLYPFARSANVHVIEIDAVSPLDPAMDALPLIKSPVGSGKLCFEVKANSELLDVASDNALSPAAARNLATPCPAPTVLRFWWSLSNVIQMSEIITTDLVRINPDDANLLKSNFRALREQLQSVKYEYEAKFDDLDNVSVIALTDKFAYLTNDFFFNVVGYFVKNNPDDWTDDDIESLRQLIELNKVKVVIGQWMPPESVLAAIEASGSKMVILSAMDPGLALEGVELDEAGLIKLFRRNLESLLRGFAGDK